MVFHLSIDYTPPEGDTPLVYRGFTITIPTDKRRTLRFDSGKPTVDFICSLMTYKFSGGEELGLPLMCSSSLDHFVMDGGHFEEQNFTEAEIEEAKAHLETVMSKDD